MLWVTYYWEHDAQRFEEHPPNVSHTRAQVPSHLLVHNPGGMMHGVESVIPLTQVNIQVLHGHSIMPPHPSGVGPQSKSAHVVGAQSVVVDVDVVVVVVVVVSQTWAAVHISSSGQVPQFSGARVRQVPLAILPQWAPAASHVVGVQQAPAGLLPGGLLLTHSPLWPFVPQQL